MHIRNLQRLAGNYVKDQSGETSLSIAIFFSLAVAFTAILAVPFLDKTSREYADNKAYGVDSLTTSSVRSGGKPNTYIMRRSIFDKGLTKICKSSNQSSC